MGTWMDSSGGRDYYVSLNRTHPTPTPYTTISYANGPGFSFHYDNKTGFWRDLSNVDTQVWKRLFKCLINWYNVIDILMK